MKIDSHQHFWQYNANDYGWMSEEHAVIKRDFLPRDLVPLLAEADIDGSIVVQARQSLDETRWLLELADANPAIRGVVGWLPLCDSAALEASLDRFASHPKLVGVRHVIHDEPDDAFILRKDFNEGVSRLRESDLVYDILIFEKHLPATLAFVDQHPDQQFVVDHIAKPIIQKEAFDEAWRSNLIELAKRKNVACKLSGVVTEVRDPVFDDNLLHPYLEAALEAFGPNRLLFGSDWPVCLLRTDYPSWANTVRNVIASLSESEQAAILGNNAERIYQLGSC